MLNHCTLMRPHEDMVSLDPEDMSIKEMREENSPTHSQDVDMFL